MRRYGLYLAWLLALIATFGSLYFSETEVPLRTPDLAHLLTQAVTEDRIRGVFLELNSPGLSFAGAQEIRTALEALEAAGKPCTTP